MNRLIDDRTTRLFIALAAFFCVNAVLAEFIGVKIFALEDTLGIQPLEWNLFGQSGSLSFTAGTLLWPIVFIMTDTIHEYFGRRGVRSEEHPSALQSLMRISSAVFCLKNKKTHLRHSLHQNNVI